MARAPKTGPTTAEVDAFLDAVPDETHRADARNLSALCSPTSLGSLR
jgi:hypothetical protein